MAADLKGIIDWKADNGPIPGQLLLSEGPFERGGEVQNLVARAVNSGRLPEGEPDSAVRVAGTNGGR